MPRNRFKKIFTEAAAAFQGEYRDELSELMALSSDDIDALAPGTSNMETYLALIKVVEYASRNNLSQAQIIDNIKNLGEVAIKIAKKIPRFAELL